MFAANDARPGTGYGSVTVDKLGNVRFSGKLGDGTSVSQSAILSGQGQWPFYIAPYSGQGTVLGWLDFTNLAESDIDGRVDWIKLAQPGGHYYPTGFTNSAEAAGSKYSFTNGISILNWSTGAVQLVNGNLPEDFTNQIVLGINNKGSGSNQLTLTITSSSGLFQGSLIHPLTGKKINLQGAVLQNQNAGYGYFLGTNQTGPMGLTP